MRKRGLLITLSLVLLLPLAAADKEKILHFQNGAEPQSLDPHVATGVPESKILESLFEGLVTLNQKTLEPQPGMAKSWEISADGKTYTFTLREAKWSNGDAFTANDFVDSWQRMLKLDPVSEYVSLLHIIENAREYSEKKDFDFSKVGLTAPDAKTLVVKLVGPTPYFLEVLAHHAFYPVHQAKKRWKVDAEFSRPGKLVGNGAFMLKDHVSRKSLLVKRNSHYYEADKVKLDGVKFYPIDDLNTAYLLYKNKELDILDTLPLDAIEKLMEANDPEFKVAPYLGVYYYRFNVTQKPFDDVRVRKAISMAIKKSRITKLVTKGGEIPWDNMVPEGMDGFDYAPGITYDRKAAQKLLAEAGYPGGKGFPKLEILYNNSDSHQSVALAIQQMLKKNLGIEVSLINKEWKVYLDDLQKLNYMVGRSGWIGDYKDPNTFLEIFCSGNGNNRTGWSSEEFDKLIHKSMTTSDNKERYKILAKAEKILLEDCPIIPIYTYVSKHLVSSRVIGWQDNIRDIHPWKDLDLK